MARRGVQDHRMWSAVQPFEGEGKGAGPHDDGILHTVDCRRVEQVGDWPDGLKRASGRGIELAADHSSRSPHREFERQDALLVNQAGRRCDQRAWHQLNHKSLSEPVENTRV